MGKERAGTYVEVAWVTGRKIPLRKWGSEGCWVSRALWNQMLTPSPTH